MKLVLLGTAGELRGSDLTTDHVSEKFSATCGGVSYSKLSERVNQSIDKRANGHGALCI